MISLFCFLPKETGRVLLRDVVAKVDPGHKAPEEESFRDVAGVSADEDVVLGLAVEELNDARIPEPHLVILVVKGVPTQMQRGFGYHGNAVVLAKLLDQHGPLTVHFAWLVMRLQLDLCKRNSQVHESYEGTRFIISA